MTTARSATQGPINTKHITDRRELRFEQMADMLADVEQFDPETVQSDGNWTPSQNVQHVDKVIRIALDGSVVRAPWFLRAAAKLMKRSALNKAMKPGIKLPGNFTALLPDNDITWEAAITCLRESIARIESGERMTHPSPAFGRLTHEEWVQLHCRHAEMHFSFLHEA